MKPGAFSNSWRSCSISLIGSTLACDQRLDLIQLPFTPAG
jgi:hypothetical protein